MVCGKGSGRHAPYIIGIDRGNVYEKQDRTAAEAA